MSDDIDDIRRALTDNEFTSYLADMAEREGALLEVRIVDGELRYFFVDPITLTSIADRHIN